MDIAKWRPISLLCVDYKIRTKVLTNRLLPNLVSPKYANLQQPLQNKGLNRILKQEKYTTYILNFNQEKGFGKFDRNYMFKCLEKMNYLKEYIEFIQIIYRETYSEIQNNEYFSESIKFTLNRRIH